MVYEFTPRGICARKIIIKLNGDIIEDVKFMGGCSGNTQGVSALVKGRTKQEVIELLDGINCGIKGTSCPDQLAKALKSIE